MVSDRGRAFASTEKAAGQAPGVIELPFLQQHGWLAAPLILGWFAGFAFLILRPCMHLRWNLTDELIQSTQPGRNGAYSRAWPNAEFIAAEAWGPVLRVRRQSGETYVWPRWLFRARKVYVFELQNSRLCLRPLRPATADG